MAGNRPRLFIEIDAVTLRQLILWAKSKGEKKNTWARIVVSKGCDDSRAEVTEWYEAQAKRLGVTVEEIENAVLKEEGFDFEKYRAELLGDKS